MFRSFISVRSAIAIVLIGIVIKDSNARAPSKIVGGTDAEPGEFPWQVSLRIYDSHICGGTIIGTRHILTAAHCVVGIVEAPYSEMTIVTGSNTLRPGTGKAYRVKDIVVHEKYVSRTRSRAVQNDIAVISLRKEIEFNEFQGPISMPIGRIPNGARGIVTGFGRTDYENGKSSMFLQKLNVTLLSNADCFANGVRVQRHQICGFEAIGYGVCKGDSGGPLVYNREIIGIVSTAMKCGFGIPDTYTSVYEYLDFIKKVMVST